MRAENIVTGPVQQTYKYGVYGALGFCGVFLAGFIAWGFSCLGGAAVELVNRLI
jgi:hypothetical protein